MFLDPILGNLINNLKYGFIWPWVGPYLKYRLNMGPGMASGSTRVVPLPATHPSRTTPGTPLLTSRRHPCPHCPYTESKVVVGLKSVAQLSLYAGFSGFQGITEGYNLAIAGNPDDHLVIPGNK